MPPKMKGKKGYLAERLLIKPALFSTFFFFFSLGGNPISFLLLASPIVLFRSGQIIRVLWSDWSIKNLFRDYFGVIEKGITERRQEEMLQGMMEKLQALEGGRVLDI